MTDADLWAAALDGNVPLARTALDRLCLSYGAVAGDLALAHGPHAVVLAGGLTQRTRAQLPDRGFPTSFSTQGTVTNHMGTTTVLVARHEGHATLSPQSH